MILDSLDNAGFYGGLPPGLVWGLEWLCEHRAALPTLAVGRHEIDGDRLFALVQDVLTKPLEQCRYESHRRYHDIQYVITGVECMGYAAASGLRLTEPYDAGRDVMFYDGVGDAVTVRAGCFALFTPLDAHAPTAMVGSPTLVKKVVLKVEA